MPIANSRSQPLRFIFIFATLMREVLELDSGEICKELSITSTNLWVILYRARVALGLCPEQHWFAAKGRAA